MENHTDNAAEDRSLTDGVGFLLARASGSARARRQRRAGPLGLRVRSYSVLLLACEAAEGISQRDLAAVLGLDPSQVVLLVDDLAGAGLVERRPSPSDRRTKLVAATATGRALRAEAVAAVAAPRRSSSRLCLPPSAGVCTTCCCAWSARRSRSTDPESGPGTLPRGGSRLPGAR